MACALCIYHTSARRRCGVDLSVAAYTQGREGGPRVEARTEVLSFGVWASLAGRFPCVCPEQQRGESGLGLVSPP